MDSVSPKPRLLPPPSRPVSRKPRTRKGAKSRTKASETFNRSLLEKLKQALHEQSRGYKQQGVSDSVSDRSSEDQDSFPLRLRIPPPPSIGQPEKEASNSLSGQSLKDQHSLPPRLRLPPPSPPSWDDPLELVLESSSEREELSMSNLRGNRRVKSLRHPSPISPGRIGEQSTVAQEISRPVLEIQGEANSLNNLVQSILTKTPFQWQGVSIRLYSVLN